MKKVPCYVCACESYSLYATENGYNLVKCEQCGLLYVNPRPDDQDISDDHRSGVHRGEEAFDNTGSFNYTKIPIYKAVLQDFYANELQDNAFEGWKWLDIGCGHGEFIAAVEQYSRQMIHASGLEPNVKKQASAQKHGLEVSFFDPSSRSERYDVISFLNVYSHLPDPPVAIAQWKGLLHPGGELFLETGDATLMREAEFHRPFDLPDHLSFATQEIIVRILEHNGFDVLAIKKYPFVRARPTTIAKEILKIAWPGKHSRLKYLFNPILNNNDMFVRARLKNSSSLGVKS